MRQHKVDTMNFIIDDIREAHHNGVWLCDCPTHRGEFTMKRYRRFRTKYQRNWKQYRKTQYKT